MRQSHTKDANFFERVVVGRIYEPQSAVFRIWSPRGKSDVYAGVREITGEIKISLHETGECNAGLTTQFAMQEVTMAPILSELSSFQMVKSSGSFGRTAPRVRLNKPFCPRAKPT